MLKDDSIYIEHILECITKIQAYTSNISKEQFATSDLIQDAVIRNIEVIGEASKKVSQDLKQTYFEIPWKEIAGMRDKLIHDYLGVDIDVIWKTILEDIPALNSHLNKI
jgi:uncharacterized protein with HEPN domain